jgi:hypothetical protein
MAESNTLDKDKIRKQEAIQFLTTIATELVGAGLDVNWSANPNSYDPGLIVNRCCLIRKNVGNTVSAKFWDIERADVKAKISAALSDRVEFASYCFDIGAPMIGEKVVAN